MQEIPPHVNYDTQQYNYIFTVTFSSRDVTTKYKKIDKLYKLFTKSLYNCNTMRRHIIEDKPFSINLLQVVEYHKKARYKSLVIKDIDELRISNSVTSPHIHGVIRSSLKIPNYIIDNIRDSLKSQYGRSEFYLEQDPDNILDKINYTLKHLLWNNQLYPTYQHRKDVDLYLTMRQYYLRQQERLDDDNYNNLLILPNRFDVEPPPLYISDTDEDI